MIELNDSGGISATEYYRFATRSRNPPTSCFGVFPMCLKQEIDVQWTRFLFLKDE
jgi:hypothetical protein